MSTAFFSTPIDHSNDAGFRAWVSEFITQLAAAGAVQTADTGQINTATATKPAANTNAGYAIFRTPDSSLYFKFEFGSQANVANPRLMVTVGTGSNGSGTITGQTNTASAWFTDGNAIGSSSTNYPSRICCKAGYLGISWKEGAGAAGQPYGLLIVGRSVDATQAVTTDGFCIVRRLGTNGLYVQSVRTLAPAATMTEFAISSRNYGLSCIPGGETSSTDSAGNSQAYLWWMNVKDVQPFMWGCTVAAAEAGAGTMLSVAMVGTTAHTYVVIGTGNVLNSPVNSSAFTLAMMWE